MKTLSELNSIKEQYRSSVAIRTEDYDIRVVVGMGNSGLVSGARDIFKTLVKRIEEDGLSGRVIVTQEARVSKVGYNPVVRIIDKGIKTATYSNVTKEIALRIVDEHIKDGKIVKEHLLVEEKKEEGNV